MLVPYVGQVVSRSVLSKAVPAVKQLLPTISSFIAGLGLTSVLGFMQENEPEMTSAVASGLGVSVQDIQSTAQALTSSTASSGEDATLLGYDLEESDKHNVSLDKAWYTNAGIALAIIALLYLVVTRTNTPKYVGDLLASFLNLIGLDGLARSVDSWGEEQYAASLEDKRADQRENFRVYEAQLRMLKGIFGGTDEYAVNCLKIFATIDIAKLEDYVDLKNAIAGS